MKINIYFSISCLFLFGCQASGNDFVGYWYKNNYSYVKVVKSGEVFHLTIRKGDNSSFRNHHLIVHLRKVVLLIFQVEHVF
jgi:hypothetical protein